MATTWEYDVQHTDVIHEPGRDHDKLDLLPWLNKLGSFSWEVVTITTIGPILPSAAPGMAYHKPFIRFAVIVKRAR